MGLLTPFLPCGPLYAVFIALMASGSAARGSTICRHTHASKIAASRNTLLVTPLRRFNMPE